MSEVVEVKNETSGLKRSDLKMIRAKEYEVPVSEIRENPVNEVIYSAASVEDLVQSMREMGQLESIVVNNDGEIISGHRRYAAAKLLNWEKVRVKFVNLKDSDDIELSLVSYNSHRKKTARDFYNEYTVFARVLARKKLLPSHAKGERKLDHIAERIGLNSGRQLHRLIYSMENGSQTIKDQLCSGEISISNAEAQTRVIMKSQEPEKVRKLHDTPGIVSVQQAKAKAKGESVVYKEPPKFVNDISTEETFGSIIVRPPLNLEELGYFTKNNVPWFTMDYKPISIEEACDLKVNGRAIADLAAEDAYLFLVIPPKAIFAAEDILKAYGFEYATLLMWCRPAKHWGEYYGESGLPIVVGRRGHAKPSNEMKNTANHFSAAVPKDIMAMPDNFYEMVQITTEGPYLEIFTTQPRDGWSSHVMKNFKAESK